VLARLGSLEFLVKDRQSGAVSSLQGQVIRPKLDAKYLAASRRIRKTVPDRLWRPVIKT
jgi:hypothetical protein